MGTSDTNKEKKQFFSVEANKAIIGGAIAILLSPISIVIAYYLGQRLDAPKLEITNVEQIFDYKKQEKLFLPDSISNPIKSNQQVILLLEQEALEDVATYDSLDNVDAKDMVVGLGNVKGKLLFSRKALETNLERVRAWDGKSEIQLTAVDLANYLGNRSLEDLVTTNRNQAINILSNFINTINDRVREIDTYIQYIKPYSQTKMDSIRTGSVVFKVGILNSGNTDAVAFPKCQVNFNSNVLNYESAPNKDNYALIKAHTFQMVYYRLSTAENKNSTLDEWKAIVSNHNAQSFSLTIPTSYKELEHNSELKSK
ncbi:hypothetical protein [Foetidibacter luteolus]|uniref:hypothetical protein n=1 Tax=Foetidibacter luteolus TaxID=2608880 RepID=UPI00129A66C5|nr:hypothetical protein [Foetidibacter luteolus]